MSMLKVHPKFAVLCVLIAVFVLGDIRTAQAGCWLEKTRCSMIGDLGAPTIGLVVQSKSNARASEQRFSSYTVSFQGVSSMVKANDHKALGQSALVMRKGSDGEIGDIALGLADGGSLTVDLREDFLKVQYTLDF